MDTFAGRNADADPEKVLAVIPACIRHLHAIGERYQKLLKIEQARDRQAPAPALVRGQRRRMDRWLGHRPAIFLIHLQATAAKLRRAAARNIQEDDSILLRQLDILEDSLIHRDLPFHERQMIPVLTITEVAFGGTLTWLDTTFSLPGGPADGLIGAAATVDIQGYTIMNSGIPNLNDDYIAVTVDAGTVIAGEALAGPLCRRLMTLADVAPDLEQEVRAVLHDGSLQATPGIQFNMVLRKRPDGCFRPMYYAINGNVSGDTSIGVPALQLSGSRTVQRNLFFRAGSEMIMHAHRRFMSARAFGKEWWWWWYLEHNPADNNRLFDNLAREDSKARRELNHYTEELARNAARKGPEACHGYTAQMVRDFRDHLIQAAIRRRGRPLDELDKECCEALTTVFDAEYQIEYFDDKLLPSYTVLPPRMVRA